MGQKVFPATEEKAATLGLCRASKGASDLNRAPPAFTVLPAFSERQMTNVCLS
jgi:hypothetical protein